MAASRTAQGRGRRGFSLVEVLIVIAVLGLAFSLGLAGVNAAFKRQRVASTADQLKTLAGRTLTEMQNRNVQTFLVFGKYVAGLGTDVVVAVDTNGNGTLDVDKNNDGLFDDGNNDDLVLNRVRVPEDVSLSLTSVTGQTFNAQWSRPAAGSVSALLMCDFMGRAMIPGGTATMITAPATVDLSHKDQIAGKLTPLGGYRVSIGPLFRASLLKGFKPLVTTPDASVEWKPL